MAYTLTIDDKAWPAIRDALCVQDGYTGDDPETYAKTMLLLTILQIGRGQIRRVKAAEIEKATAEALYAAADADITAFDAGVSLKAV